MGRGTGNDSTMTITEPQKEEIRRWAAEGAGLGEIHKRIQEDFGVTMTYLEARLLVAELDIRFKSEESEKEPAALSADPELSEEEEVEAFPGEAGEGGVSVSVDAVTQPSALVSGKVTFSDGKRATWYVDQLGRLGIDPEQPGYRPSEPDVAVFQRKLQDALASKGF